VTTSEFHPQKRLAFMLFGLNIVIPENYNYQPLIYWALLVLLLCCSCRFFYTIWWSYAWKKTPPRKLL